MFSTAVTSIRGIHVNIRGGLPEISRVQRGLLHLGITSILCVRTTRSCNECLVNWPLLERRDGWWIGGLSQGALNKEAAPGAWADTPLGACSRPKWILATALYYICVCLWTDLLYWCRVSQCTSLTKCYINVRVWRVMNPGFLSIHYHQGVQTTTTTPPYLTAIPHDNTQIIYHNDKRISPGFSHNIWIFQYKWHNAKEQLVKTGNMHKCYLKRVKYIFNTRWWKLCLIVVEQTF